MRAVSYGQLTWRINIADELEKILILLDTYTVAAVLMEPVTGSGGVMFTPVGYLVRIKEI